MRIYVCEFDDLYQGGSLLDVCSYFFKSLSSLFLYLALLLSLSMLSFLLGKVFHRHISWGFMLFGAMLLRCTRIISLVSRG